MIPLRFRNVVLSVQEILNCFSLLLDFGNSRIKYQKIDLSSASAHTSQFTFCLAKIMVLIY